jgi:uncharacterized membrane protein YraQ (UPF0718 family)
MLFGIKITVIYNLIGIAVAVFGGMLIQHLRLERFVEPGIMKFRSGFSMSEKKTPWPEDAWKITRQVFPYVVLGVGIGALIHGFVPEGLASEYLSEERWWSVPLAVLLGAPFYANSVSIIPVLEAMISKGVPLGTALAFATSVVTVSLPELLILRKAMKPQLIAIFLATTIVGIILMGFAMNAIF